MSGQRTPMGVSSGTDPKGHIPGPIRSSRPEGDGWDARLMCGVLIAPFFYLTATLQMLFREGFDLRRHPLSLLSLGPYGWIQVLNFVTTGLLAIALAFGLRTKLRRGMGHRAIPTLIAAFGAGLIIAGLAPSDPILNFPPGSGDGIPAHMSTHAAMHGVGFMVAFVSLLVAFVTLARRFWAAGCRSWSIGSGLVTSATIALLALGMAVQSATGIAFYVVGLVAFGWLSLLSCFSLRA